MTNEIVKIKTFDIESEITDITLPAVKFDKQYYISIIDNMELSDITAGFLKKIKDSAIAIDKRLSAPIKQWRAEVDEIIAHAENRIAELKLEKAREEAKRIEKRTDEINTLFQKIKLDYKLPEKFNKAVIIREVYFNKTMTLNKINLDILEQFSTQEKLYKAEEQAKELHQQKIKNRELLIANYNTKLGLECLYSTYSLEKYPEDDQVIDAMNRLSEQKKAVAETNAQVQPQAQKNKAPIIVDNSSVETSGKIITDAPVSTSDFLNIMKNDLNTTNVKVIKIEKGEHSKYSASGSHRWLNCMPSLTLDRGVKVRPSYTITKEGTMCHYVAEICIKDKTILPVSYIGKEFEVEGEIVKFTEKHSDYVETYLDYIQSILTSSKLSTKNMQSEIKVSFEKYVKDGFGTVDCVIVDNKEKVIHIIDLKTGFIGVNSDNNSQLKLYALGVLNTFEKLKYGYDFYLHIYQPSTLNIDATFISRDDVLKFGDYVKNVVDKNSQERNAGDWCKYCPNNPTCTKLSEYTKNIAINDFEDLEIHEGNQSRMLEIFEKSDMIKDYLNKLDEYFYAIAMSGKKIKGYKLIRGISRRKLLEDAEPKIKQLLGDNAYRKSLLNMSDLEKLIDKNVFATLVYKPEAQLKLVPESAKGEAVSLVNNYDNDFKEVDM